MTDKHTALFASSVLTYDSVAVVQNRVANHLVELCQHHVPQGLSIFEVGCGTGLLTLPMVRALKPSHLTLNDISPEMLTLAMSRTATIMPSAVPLVGNAEDVPWPSAQVVASASAVQWFNSPLAFVSKAQQTILSAQPQYCSAAKTSAYASTQSPTQPKGYVALATYGPLTFCELRRGAPAPELYPTLPQWQKALTDHGFSLLECEERTHVQHYASRQQMLRMIALSGMGHDRAHQSSGHMGAGPTQLTWHIIWLVAALS